MVGFFNMLGLYSPGFYTVLNIIILSFTVVFGWSITSYYLLQSYCKVRCLLLLSTLRALYLFDKL